MTLHARTGGLRNFAGTGEGLPKFGETSAGEGLRNSPQASSTERRQALALRARIEAAAEALIALLDELDAPAEDLEPDADGEDGGDWEPWLACPEHCERQLPWCRGCDDDRENG